MTEKIKESVNKKPLESSGTDNGSANKCCVCYHACDTSCARCSQYYCSRKCQSFDWPQHRYICGKPKHRDNWGICVMEPSNTNTSQADTPTTLTATTTEICYRDEKAFVHSSRAVTPTTTTTNEIYYRNYLQQKVLPSGENVKFFVMDNSLINTGCISCTIKPYAIEIQKFQKELQVYAESFAKESYTPRDGELCVARYSLDGLWYRGLCLESVGDGQHSIHFIDYGNVSVVPIQYIRRYSAQLTHPIYTADCAIKGLPDEFDDKLVTKLKQLIPEGKTIKCKNVTAFEEENFYIISLPKVIKDINVCLDEKAFVHSSRAVTPTTTTTNEIYYRNYLQQKVLPSGENVKFFVMDNSLINTGCISCTIKPYAIEIQKFQKELQVYAESFAKESYTPRDGELCVARYSLDGLWYRGLCLESVGDGQHSIHFIDYGNVSVVPIQYIRRYSAQLTHPIYTADCAIKGLPDEFDDKLVTKLKQLIPEGKTIKCKNVTAFEEENFYIISLPKVIKDINVCLDIQGRAFVHSSRAVTPTTPPTTIYYRNYLQQKVLPSGENVKFFVMDNSAINAGFISCTIKPYVIEIQKFQKELQVYAESIAKESYTPRDGELCVARYSLDGLWYRCLCLEYLGDGQHSIHFIDYGNVSVAPIQYIRRYSAQLNYPIYTADCQIEGLPDEFDDKLVTKRKQLIPVGKTIKCKKVIAFEDENFYIIFLP